MSKVSAFDLGEIAVPITGKRAHPALGGCIVDLNDVQAVIFGPYLGLADDKAMVQFKPCVMFRKGSTSIISADAGCRLEQAWRAFLDKQAAA